MMDKKERFELTLPADLKSAMETLARRSGLSWAAWIRTLIAARANEELGTSWIKGETEVS
jgi:hypothetical protein